MDMLQINYKGFNSITKKDMFAKFTQREAGGLSDTAGVLATCVAVLALQ